MLGLWGAARATDVGAGIVQGHLWRHDAVLGSGECRCGWGETLYSLWAHCPHLQGLFKMPEFGGSWSVTVIPSGGIPGPVEMLPNAFLTWAAPGFGIVFPELGMGHPPAWPTW